MTTKNKAKDLTIAALGAENTLLKAERDALKTYVNVIEQVMQKAILLAHKEK